MARPSNEEIERELIDEVQRNFADAEAADSENRRLAVEDVRFVDEEGAQWDSATLAARGKDRPAYTFDRTSMAIDQVKGDQRQNSPRIKIRPIDNKSDRQKAEIFEGLIRNIEANSFAKAAYDNGFDFALKGGFGAWRVYPKYVDDTFDQELCIGWIENPFTVHFDPSAKDQLKRDAGWALITERMNKKAFEKEHPKKPTSSLDGGSHDKDWFTKDEIRIGEYFKRVPKKKTIALLDDGRVIDYGTIQAIEEELRSPPPASGITPIRVVRKREADSFVIRWWKISGAGILEGPIDYNWKYIPIVPVFGRCSNIEGKRKYRGLVRKAKDPQKSYNHSRTAMIEAIAQVPRSPFLITPAQIKGFEAMWNLVNAKNLPYLFYNTDSTAPNGGKPMREPMPEVPQALVSLALQAADDIKASTGKFGPSLGEPQANELPGAIRQRNTEGDVASFEFIDNLASSMQYTGQILVDMIPTVYDSERIVRILGIDGKEDFVEINKRMPNGELLNDLSQGRYDVTVDVGPAYTTQRQEAADNLMRLAGTSELVQEAAPDLIASFLDFYGADRLEKRLRYIMLQRGLIPPSELTDDDQKNMPQSTPQPSPSEMALVQRLTAQAARDSAEAQKTQIETAQLAQGTQLDAQKKVIELRKLMAETMSVMLDNLLKQGEIGIDPRSGKVMLMKHLTDDERAA
jgi:hypothetical protein